MCLSLRDFRVMPLPDLPRAKIFLGEYTLQPVKVAHTHAIISVVY